MVKTPRTRHSSKAKEPVTIDLEPDAVSRGSTQAGPGTAAGTASPKTATTAEKPGPAEATSPKSESSSTEPPASAGSASRPDAAKASAGGTASASNPSGKGGTPPFGRDGRQDGAARPEVAETGRRGGGMLAAGVAGGVVALALGAGLQFTGLLPSGPSQPEATQDPAIPALEAQVEELRQTIAALPQPQDADPALAGRLEDAEQRLGALSDEVERQRAQIEGLQAPAPGEPAPQVDLGPIEARIAALETAIAGLGGATSPDDVLATVDEEIAGLRQTIEETRGGQQALTGRVDRFEVSLSALEQRLEEVAEAPATSIIIAASALKAAIDRGQPFVNELETFAALAPDAPEIAELREMAATGVPTRAQIGAESDDAANTMIAAARPVDPDAGIIDRLWASAMGLIQVRPIGMVEGEGVPEIVARLDAAVTAGDYGRAIEEFETLPDDARSAGEGFIGKVRARHAADTLIDQALAAALRA